MKENYFMFGIFHVFWNASGNFWDNQWEKVLRVCDYDEFKVSFIGTFLLTFFIYWFFGFFYTFFDITKRPAFLQQYKIQDTSINFITIKQLFGIIRQVLINQIVAGLPVFLTCYLILAKWRGYNWTKTPTFVQILYELMIFILIEELGFYYSHRLLHHPRLYKYIHKKHHEWKSPIAITAIYCHPVEYIFSNLLPAYLGPLILGSNLATMWLWFSLALLSTLNAHCGYHFPFFPSPEAHDYHHLKFNQNFGIIGILDRLHGTDSMFRRTSAYRRHFLLLSLSPIKKNFVDTNDDTSEDPFII